MVNYGNGKIYKIISSHTNKIYIGSTAKKYLSERMYEHRKELRHYEMGIRPWKTTSWDIIKYNDAKIILIEKWPCTCREELLQREQYWQDQNKDICINKLRAYGTNRKISDEKYYINNYNKMLKRNKIPKLCIYCDKSYGRASFARHCKSQTHIDNVQFAEDILNNNI